jgi:hypothetical protein
VLPNFPDSDDDPANDDEEKEEDEPITPAVAPEAAALVAAGVIPPNYNKETAYLHALEAARHHEDTNWLLE